MVVLEILRIIWGDWDSLVEVSSLDRRILQGTQNLALRFIKHEPISLQCSSESILLIDFHECYHPCPKYPNKTIWYAPRWSELSVCTASLDQTLTWGTWSGSTFHLRYRSQRSQILIFQPLGISIHQISRNLMYLVGALSKLEKTSVTDINNSRCLTWYFAFWTSALSDGAPLPTEKQIMGS